MGELCKGRSCGLLKVKVGFISRKSVDAEDDPGHFLAVFHVVYTE